MRERLVLPLMMHGKHRGKIYLRGEHPGLFPSANHIYINTGTGRRLSPIAERKLEEWKDFSMEWAEENRWEMTRSQKVVIRLWYYLNDNRRKDTHNTLKLLLDALEGVIYEDDRLALPRVMDFEIDRDDPRIEIEVETI